MKICNLDYLKSITPGSNALAIQIITLFIKDTPESMKGILSEIETGNFEGIYKHAHKIKPSVAMIGVPSATNDALLKINELSKAGVELDKIKELATFLDAELDRTYIDLEESLKEMEQ
jgi:HPt (histidine-containing phosphotransfer) domain-containing protein